MLFASPNSRGGNLPWLLTTTPPGPPDETNAVRSPPKIGFVWRRRRSGASGTAAWKSSAQTVFPKLGSFGAEGGQLQCRLTHRARQSGSPWRPARLDSEERGGVPGSAGAILRREFQGRQPPLGSLTTRPLRGRRTRRTPWRSPPKIGFVWRRRSVGCVGHGSLEIVGPNRSSKIGFVWRGRGSVPVSPDTQGTAVRESLAPGTPGLGGERRSSRVGGREFLRANSRGGNLPWLLTTTPPGPADETNAVRSPPKIGFVWRRRRSGAGGHGSLEIVGPNRLSKIGFVWRRKGVSFGVA